mgnify:CR=1 FL=1
MSKQVVSEQDRRRKRGMIVFQVVIYTIILAEFLFQLHLY